MPDVNLLVITPIYRPTTGGAATYYSTLAECLLASGKVSRLTVITERVQGQLNDEITDGGKLRILRIFPHRAGRQLGRLQKYWRYALQNLQYLLLPLIVKKLNFDLMLIHSSFHNNINLFYLLIPYFAKNAPVVADIRDQQLPLKRFKQLTAYTALIACSLNIVSHISKSACLERKLKHIPVIQENIEKLRSESRKTLVKYELHSRKFFLFAGLIKRAKGVNLLLETFEVLRTRGIDVDLILAGLSKDETLVREIELARGVRMIGSVPREELLDLMSEALLNLNISLSEGMPRSSLEALSLGASVLLPNGVPEFEEHCPTSVVAAHDSHVLADQIEAIISSALIVNAYPIEIHAVERVIPIYLDLFQSQIYAFKERL